MLSLVGKGIRNHDLGARCAPWDMFVPRPFQLSGLEIYFYVHTYVCML
jgi:hypothetical protein